jgi:hypothetical protein
MRQPAGTYTEADLERIIARDFAQDSIPAVKALLSRYGKESWQRGVLRVQMACLKCANGDLAALERAVENAAATLGAGYRGCDALGRERQVAHTNAECVVERIGDCGSGRTHGAFASPNRVFLACS